MTPMIILIGYLSIAFVCLIVFMNQTKADIRNGEFKGRSRDDLLDGGDLVEAMLAAVLWPIISLAAICSAIGKGILFCFNGRR